MRQWRKRCARGRVVIARYCDDFALDFQFEANARRMLAELKQRLAKFHLTLHDEKTRIIEFGRLPALRRAERVSAARRPLGSWASPTTAAGLETGISS